MDSPTRFHELDVLRGLAALAVVVFHYSGHCVRYFGDFPFRLEIGEHGVQLFFVISGFVISWTLEKCTCWQDFVVSRFSRLFPTYWAVLLLLLLTDIFVLRDSVWWRAYAVNATMVQSLVGFPDIDIVFWTLGVELMFYILMGIVLSLGIFRRIVRIALSWLAICTLTVVISSLSGKAIPSILTTVLIVPHAAYFVAGVMFYFIRTRGPRVEYLAVIGLALVVCWIVGGHTMGLVAVVVIAVCGLAVAGYLAFMVNPLTLWLGAISYPLYLVHRNLGYEALFALNRSGVNSTAAFFLVVAGALALASVLAYGVERPAMAILRAAYKRRAQLGTALGR